MEACNCMFVLSLDTLERDPLSQNLMEMMDERYQKDNLEYYRWVYENLLAN